DELQRSARPVARHLRRSQLVSDRQLGELGGVLPLVLRRAAAVAERRIGAVGLRVVADVEVRTELRGGHVEAAADEAVSGGDGHEYERQPEEEESQRTQRTRRAQRLIWLGVLCGLCV